MILYRYARMLKEVEIGVGENSNGAGKISLPHRSKILGYTGLLHQLWHLIGGT
jgi:hypothetical protein